MADDGSSLSPLVAQPMVDCSERRSPCWMPNVRTSLQNKHALRADFFQVAKHSVAAFHMIVRANFASLAGWMIEIAQQLDHVLFPQNFKSFAKMFVL